MADGAFAVAKEVFYHSNHDNFTLRDRLNYEKLLFILKFNYIDSCLYCVKTFNQLKLI